MFRFFTKFSIICALLYGGFIVSAQERNPGFPKSSKVVVEAPMEFGDSYEISRPVAANASFSLCSRAETVKINGWNRNELRIFVKNGSRPDVLNGTEIIASAGTNNKNRTKKCIEAKLLEIDIPRGASISVKSQESNVEIDSVKSANVTSGSGKITASNISAGCVAETHDGNIELAEISGTVEVKTLNGNVTGIDLQQLSDADRLQMRTQSGRITVRNVIYDNLGINSTSGNIRIFGDPKIGAKYALGTTSGYIRLFVTPEASIRVAASMAGRLLSELPFTAYTFSSNVGVRSVTATIGKGESTINVTSFSGELRIAKFEEK